MVVGDAVPELLPARMLNQYVYCPRLFYLEWVDKQWADNEFTVDGTYHHRAVDQASGAAPAPDDEEDLIKATSVELSSASLRLIAKLDVVESNDGSTVPVDTKRGKPRDVEHAVFLPERVQLAAQMLLLRDAGYNCDRGAIYFAEARRRVDVPLTEELAETTLAAITDALETAASDTAPPPLEDSPKCDGCSLVGICLPDETRSIRGDRVEPPRRLMAPDSPARPMYVTTPGAYVGKSSRRVVVRLKREEIGSARLVDVSQVCVFGNGQVSTQLVHLLMDSGVNIYWFSRGGWLKGVTSGMPAKNVELRRCQVHLAEDDERSLAVARSMIEGKIRNQRTLLQRNGRDVDAQSLTTMMHLSRRTRHVDQVGSLLGLEGSAARLYFQSFSKMLKPKETAPRSEFDISSRNRRPPTDPTNALLSFAYALLTKDCLAAALSVGFDPYLGVLHRPRFGRPALALDVAEEFRPLVADSTVIRAINGGMVRAGDFVERAGGVALTASGRRSFLEEYERRMDMTLRHPMFGYEVTYRRAIELQFRLLGSLVLGEIDRYTPLRTR